MQQETYAVIEISKKYIKFVVGKYKEKTGLKIVFKERERNKTSWLTENNEIIDTNVVSHKLQKMINSYEMIYKEKIQRVSMVYPTGTLDIKDASQSVFIDTPNKRVTKEHKTELYKKAKRVIYDENRVVTNIKAYEFRLNNQHSFAKAPIGAQANEISIYAKVYSTEKQVIESFDKILKNLNLEKIAVINQLYSLAKQCSEGLSFRETFSLINWDWDCTDIGFFSKETLVTKRTINFGIKHIIENLAAKMGAKFDIADKYIFKLINFLSKTSDDTVIYRKYIEAEKRTLELKSIEIKELILDEMNAIINATDIQIAREMANIRKFKVYHVGKITEIAGFEKILLNSDFKSVTEVYYSLVTGASEIWTNSLCGIIKYTREINKSSKEFRTSTAVYPNPALVFANQVQQKQKMLQIPVQQNRTMMQQQFMNQNQQFWPQMVAQQNYQNNENYLKNGIINTQRNK